jgi:hypothetical protein
VASSSPGSTYIFASAHTTYAFLFSYTFFLKTRRIKSMTANQMLEMIVEQSVEELDRYEEFQELYPHQNKFTLEVFNQFELAIYLKMSNIKKESL